MAQPLCTSTVSRRAVLLTALLACAHGQQQAIAEPRGWDDFGDHGHCAASAGLRPLRHDPGADRAEEWVRAHNHYRACHGSGAVVWNPHLADYAKAWVEKLLQHCDGTKDLWDWVAVEGAGIHRPHDGGSYFQLPRNGDNVWAGSGVAAHGGNAFEVSTVTSWYQEATMCPSQGISAGCGAGILNHYTAMVWKDVREIGCYVATVDAPKGPFSVASCRYSPGAGKDDFGGCNLPNTIGCDAQEVPALVAGICPRMDGLEPAPAVGAPPPDGQAYASFLSTGAQVQAQGASIVSEGRPVSDDRGGEEPAEVADDTEGAGEQWSEAQAQAQVQAQDQALAGDTDETSRGLSLPALQGLSQPGLTSLSSVGFHIGRGGTSVAPALFLLVVLAMGGVAGVALRGRLAAAGWERRLACGVGYAGVPPFFGPHCLPGGERMRLWADEGVAGAAQPEGWGGPALCNDLRVAV